MCRYLVIDGVNQGQPFWRDDGPVLFMGYKRCAPNPDWHGAGIFKFFAQYPLGRRVVKQQVSLSIHQENRDRQRVSQLAAEDHLNSLGRHWL